MKDWWGVLERVDPDPGWKLPQAVPQRSVFNPFWSWSPEILSYFPGHICPPKGQYTPVSVYICFLECWWTPFLVPHQRRILLYAFHVKEYHLRLFANRNTDWGFCEEVLGLMAFHCKKEYEEEEYLFLQTCNSSQRENSVPCFVEGEVQQDLEGMKRQPWPAGGIVLPVHRAGGATLMKIVDFSATSPHFLSCTSPTSSSNTIQPNQRSASNTKLNIVPAFLK